MDTWTYATRQQPNLSLLTSLISLKQGEVLQGFSIGDMCKILDNPNQAQSHENHENLFLAA